MIEQNIERKAGPVNVVPPLKYVSKNELELYYVTMIGIAIVLAFNFTQR